MGCFLLNVPALREEPVTESVCCSARVGGAHSRKIILKRLHCSVAAKGTAALMIVIPVGSYGELFHIP